MALTMDLHQLNGDSSTLLLSDLKSLYVAVDMYLLFDLCSWIVKYLESLLNPANVWRDSSNRDDDREQDLGESDLPAMNLNHSTKIPSKSIYSSLRFTDIK
jgi:hypothetical protein